ncbi:MAG: DUF58 domain-containing protein [Chloroflexi bacterium]|nr:DUF58 domain-containing protein [Chloroflexota bacterium]MBA3740261.1 DUF58 domain-containing protein [Chloroflexota bacterium]
MSGWTLIGLSMVIAGGLSGAPGLLLIGGLTLLSRWLTTLWSRYGLASIGYERRIATNRAVWGDQVALHVEVWNRKLLPVPLLTADDHVTDTLRITGRTLVASERPGQSVLQNSWSLLWYERVIRHLVIDARRRGTFTFGPIRLTVSDLFERGTNSEDRELPAELLVRPRTVPVRAPHTAQAPLGTARSRASLFTDPSRSAGVRRYEPGDPMRRIHWRATARLGEPVSRRYEPVHERQVLLAVDLQTVPGPYWLMLFDDDQVEALCVAAASLARRMLRIDTACGLLLGAQLAGGRRWAYLAPSAAASQLGRIEDILARVQPILSLPFERLLGVVPKRLAPGGTVLSLGARDPEPYADRLRRLSRTGYAVTHVTFGPDREAHRSHMAALGIQARVAELSPNWREADALVLAG